VKRCWLVLAVVVACCAVPAVALADALSDDVTVIQNGALGQFDSMLNAYGGLVGIVIGIVLFSVIARMVMSWLR
jgi:hypothetical protein